MTDSAAMRRERSVSRSTRSLCTVSGPTEEPGDGGNIMPQELLLRMVGGRGSEVGRGVREGRGAEGGAYVRNCWT